MTESYEEGMAEQFRSNSRISKGLRIRGEVTGKENLIVDGSVDGPIRLEQGVLTVTEQGAIKGEVMVPEMLVHGSVRGNATARVRVKITPRGSIIGDVKTPRLTIDDGGQYEGKVDIGGEQPRS